MPEQVQNQGKSPFPTFVEVELKYAYLDVPIVYTFTRRRKKDAEIAEQERILGEGKKLSAANKLAQLVEDITGFPEFVPRNYNEESEATWRERVARFFNTEENLEFAGDALLGRDQAIFPRPTFRNPKVGGLEVNMGSKEAAG
jgi:hypothetical protein